MTSSDDTDDFFEKKVDSVFEELRQLIEKKKRLHPSEKVNSAPRSSRDAKTKMYDVINDYHVYCKLCNQHFYCQSVLNDINSFFQKHINTDYHKSCKLKPYPDEKPIFEWTRWLHTGSCNICKMQNLHAYIIDSVLSSVKLINLHFALNHGDLKDKSDALSDKTYKLQLYCSLSCFVDKFLKEVDDATVVCVLCEKKMLGTKETCYYHLGSESHFGNFIQYIWKNFKYTIKDLMNGYNLEQVTRWMLKQDFTSSYQYPVCDEQNICLMKSNDVSNIYNNIESHSGFSPKQIEDLITLVSSNFIVKNKCLLCDMNDLNTDHEKSESHLKKLFMSDSLEKHPKYHVLKNNWKLVKPNWIQIRMYLQLKEELKLYGLEIGAIADGGLKKYEQIEGNSCNVDANNSKNISSSPNIQADKSPEKKEKSKDRKRRNEKKTVNKNLEKKEKVPEVSLKPETLSPKPYLSSNLIIKKLDLLENFKNDKVKRIQLCQICDMVLPQGSNFNSQNNCLKVKTRKWITIKKDFANPKFIDPIVPLDENFTCCLLCGFLFQKDKLWIHIEEMEHNNKIKASASFESTVLISKSFRLEIIDYCFCTCCKVRISHIHSALQPILDNIKNHQRNLDVEALSVKQIKSTSENMQNNQSNAEVESLTPIKKISPTLENMQNSKSNSEFELLTPIKKLSPTLENIKNHQPNFKSESSTPVKQPRKIKLRNRNNKKVITKDQHNKPEVDCGETEEKNESEVSTKICSKLKALDLNALENSFNSIKDDIENKIVPNESVTAINHVIEMEEKNLLRNKIQLSDLEDRLKKPVSDTEQKQNLNTISIVNSDNAVEEKNSLRDSDLNDSPKKLQVPKVESATTATKIESPKKILKRNLPEVTTKQKETKKLDKTIHGRKRMGRKGRRNRGILEIDKSDEEAEMVLLTGIPKNKRRFEELEFWFKDCGKLKSVFFEGGMAVVIFVEDGIAQKVVDDPPDFIKDHNLEVTFSKTTIKSATEKFSPLHKEIIELFEEPQKLMDWTLALVSQSVIFSQSTQRERHVCNTVMEAVSRYFPYSRCYPFGSRLSGLTLKDSDFDIYLDCGGMYESYCNMDHSDEEKVLNKVAAALRGHQCIREIFVIDRARVPIVSFLHKPTLLHCDLSIKNGLSVQNTLLLRFLLSLDWRVKPMILCLKLWADLNDIHGPPYFSSYAIALMVIFYLEQLDSPVLPTIETLQNNFKGRRLTIGGWDPNFSTDVSLLPKIENEEPFPKLLLSFFEFYAGFEYNKYVISPLTGKPLLRAAFSNSSDVKLPMCIKRHVLNIPLPLSTVINKDMQMCLMDPFDLSHILTKGFSKRALRRFIHFCELSSALLKKGLQIC